MKNTQKSLKARGYKVVETQKPKVELNQSMEKIAESFANITEKFQQQNTDNNFNLNKVLTELVQKQEPKIEKEIYVKKTWEFDIQRGKDGYISKIFAKEV